jgi:hypothetical protein
VNPALSRFCNRCGSALEGVHRFEGTVNQYTGDVSWRSSARLHRENGEEFLATQAEARIGS